MERQRVLARNAPGDVRHVDHAIDVAVQTDEQAEFSGVLDFAFDFGTDRELLGEFVPRIALCLLEAERDATLFAVDFEDYDLDFLRRADDLARMDVLLGPAHFRDVDKALDARLQLDEGTVFGDVGDLTRTASCRRDTWPKRHPTDRFQAASCRARYAACRC